MLNTYQNITSVITNQTLARNAVRDMFNLEAYYELCKSNKTPLMSFRCDSEFRNTTFHERTRHSAQHVYTNRILLQDREKDCHLYRLPDCGVDFLYYLLAPLLEWAESVDLQD